MNNIIPAKTVRQVQLETLEQIASSLECTFGPSGSITGIYKENSFPRFTKDGISVLRELKFDKPIEQSIVANIDSICTEQVKVVGDATTSIVLLSNILFKKLNENYPYDSTMDKKEIMRVFRKVVNDIIAKIKENAQPIDMDKIRDIALISTNNDEFLTQLVCDAYEQCGFDVHIQVEASMNGETYQKDYDALVLECGVYDQSFINTPNNKESIIGNKDNPACIYAFEDPIDTIVMGAFFDRIITDNILNPMTKLIEYRKSGKDLKKIPNDCKVIPTVIMAPKISRDYSNKIESTIEYIFKSCPNEAKPPLLIISNITNEDKGVYDDICTLCGCKKIRKYIDPKIEEEDVKNGVAPDYKKPETIHNFFGTCEQVISDHVSTKIFTPKHYWIDPDNQELGHTELYTNHLAKLEAEYEKAKSEGKKIVDTYKYRQRISAIKGTMLDIYVGGISAQDRDQKSDLLEDAVLNCRSACKHGVGYGANFEALRAIESLCPDGPVEVDDEGELYLDLLYILRASYIELGKKLYNIAANGDEEKAKSYVLESLENNSPFNIRTKKFEGVLSSIETDQCVLNSIAEILIMMFVTNQMILFDINRCDYFSK